MQKIPRCSHRPSRSIPFSVFDMGISQHRSFRGAQEQRARRQDPPSLSMRCKAKGISARGLSSLNNLVNPAHRYPTGAQQVRQHKKAGGGNEAGMLWRQVCRSANAQGVFRDRSGITSIQGRKIPCTCWTTRTRSGVTSHHWPTAERGLRAGCRKKRARPRKKDARVVRKMRKSVRKPGIEPGETLAPIHSAPHEPPPQVKHPVGKRDKK